MEIDFKWIEQFLSEIVQILWPTKVFENQTLECLNIVKTHPIYWSHSVNGLLQKLHLCSISLMKYNTLTRRDLARSIFRWAFGGTLVASLLAWLIPKRKVSACLHSNCREGGHLTHFVWFSPLYNCFVFPPFIIGTLLLLYLLKHGATVLSTKFGA